MTWRAIIPLDNCSTLCSHDILIKFIAVCVVTGQSVKLRDFYKAL